MLSRNVGTLSQSRSSRQNEREKERDRRTKRECACVRSVATFVRFCSPRWRESAVLYGRRRVAPEQQRIHSTLRIEKKEPSLRDALLTCSAHTNTLFFIRTIRRVESWVVSRESRVLQYVDGNLASGSPLLAWGIRNSSRPALVIFLLQI